LNRRARALISGVKCSTTLSSGSSAPTLASDSTAFSRTTVSSTLLSVSSGASSVCA